MKQWLNGITFGVREVVSFVGVMLGIVVSMMTIARESDMSAEAVRSVILFLLTAGLACALFYYLLHGAKKELDSLDKAAVDYLWGEFRQAMLELGKGYTAHIRSGKGFPKSQFDEMFIQVEALAKFGPLQTLAQQYFGVADDVRGTGTDIQVFVKDGKIVIRVACGCGVTGTKKDSRSRMASFDISDAELTS